ncbi:MAG TPA: ATP-binding protein [Rhodocyclaceae bacterium]
MKMPGIRVRLLVATILPAVVVAVALAAILLDRQYRSLDEALQARARAYAHQLGSAAEFGVFAGNREALQALAQATQAGDPDIVAVAIFDIRGQRLAASGATPLSAGTDPRLRQTGSRSADTTFAVAPILSSQLLAVDDLYSGVAPSQAAPPPDGYVLVEMSRVRLDAERNRQLFIGICVAIVGAMLAAWLALGIAGGVIRTILHVRDVVDRIGKGELGARVTPDPAEVMPTLETGINAMAERTERAQEFLVQQIDQATAELRRRNEEAERANAAKSRFVAAASHDLRQPLHALGLFVSRLAQLKHGPEVRPLVEHIDASVQSLQDLLDTLLDMSRLDAGLVNAKPADFAVAELLERLKLEYSGPMEEKGLALRVRPSNLWLHTDPGLLTRVLLNFAANALRYTARGGVLVACRRRSEKARLQVWDTGIGIAPEHLKDVFGEYVQLGNPERNNAKGLGLGLAICDRIARLLGLEIGVRSVPGRGSVFWIDVPLGQAQAKSEPEAALPMPNVVIEGTVVVLENEAAGGHSMVGLLAGWGCLAVGAGSAAEAAALCDEGGMTPEMIIAEYRLPGESGVSAALALRQRYGPLPVVIIGNDDALIAGAERRGFTLLNKPVRPGKLRAIVQQTLAQYQAAAEGEQPG